MINRRNKYFIISVILSLVFHYTFLNILFITPPKEEEKFSHFNIKLGLKKQMASYDPNINNNLISPKKIEEGQKKQENLAIQSVEQVAQLKKGQIPDSSIAKRNMKKNNIEIKRDIQKITSTTKQHNDDIEEDKIALQNEMTRVVENVANSLILPKDAEELSKESSIQKEKTNDSGVVIGNSIFLDEDKPVTYTKMLPLWIEQFVIYPEQAKLLKLKGIGIAEITITRDGHILKKTITKSTGHTILDNAIIDMLTKADPVIPVPPDLLPELSLLTYKMEFNLKPVDK